MTARPAARRSAPGLRWFLLVWLVGLIALAANHPGQLAFDTKLGVDIDPAGFYARLWDLWDPLEWRPRCGSARYARGRRRIGLASAWPGRAPGHLLVGRPAAAPEGRRRGHGLLGGLVGDRGAGPGDRRGLRRPGHPVRAPGDRPAQHQLPGQRARQRGGPP
jgi:hypothetical protein